MVDKYQGAVPQGASIERYRKTGMTLVKEKGKYIPYKESKTKEDKIKIKLNKLVKNNKVVSRSITKPTNIKIRMKEYNAPSVLGDENRFFKGEMNNAKKEMFFS